MAGRRSRFDGPVPKACFGLETTVYKAKPAKHLRSSANYSCFSVDGDPEKQCWPLSKGSQSPLEGGYGG